MRHYKGFYAIRETLQFATLCIFFQKGRICSHFGCCVFSNRYERLDVFVSGSRDILTRRLFQLARWHLDLALVSDEVGCLRLTPRELKKLQTNANEVKRGQKPTSRGRNKYHQFISECIYPIPQAFQAS